MSEKNLIIHSDEVEHWENLRDPKAKAEHLKVVNAVRQKPGTIEITSEKDPKTAADYFQAGDEVTLYGQSNGTFGCVTEAAEALTKKGVKVKLSDKPYSTLPWPPQNENS